MDFAITSYQREENAMIALLDAYREQSLAVPRDLEDEIARKSRKREQEARIALLALEREGVLRTPARSAR